MSFKFVAIFFLCLFLGSCSKNNIYENKSLPTLVKPPLQSVTGEVCSVLEDDIFTLENKDSFSGCEVKKNPDLFNGKIIRINGNYGFMIHSNKIHGSFLSSNEYCSEFSKSINKSILVQFRSDTDFNFIDKMNKFPVYIVAIGKFSSSTPLQKEDTTYGETPYHLEIICLEKAES